MTLEKLVRKDSFRNLPEAIKQEVLLMWDVGSKYIPVTDGIEKQEKGFFVTEKEALLLQETVKAHDSQIGTLLGVLTGPTGNEGIVGDIKDIKNMLTAMNEKFSRLDKDQAILDEKNAAAHIKMKDDIDGIGRKAEHAAKKADKVECDFEQYRKEQIEKEQDDIDKKKESRFQWYHAVIGGLGSVLVILEIVSMVR